jgi:uncharacterized membrane protein (DUF485 family)
MAVEREAEIPDVPAFGVRELKRRKLRISIPLLVLALGSYFLALLGFAYWPDVMGQKLIGAFNVAYLVAVAVFVITFAVAAIHARYANREIDPLAAEIRKHLEADAGVTER